MQAGNAQATRSFFLRPVQIIRNYKPGDFKFDLAAGLTVGIVLLPQAIVYALIAELPPYMGIYTAVIGTIVGGLWGSSNQLHTGPTNTNSLLVLSVLLPLFIPGSPEYILAAGLLAVMVGVFKLVMGVARLGILANFVSDSVIVGFTGGAGILIFANQIRHLLRLNMPSSPGLIETATNVFLYLPSTHFPSLLIGTGSIIVVVVLKKYKPQWPGALISMVIASIIVIGFKLNEGGVVVVGELPRGLPPLADLPLFNLDMIGKLSTGALAIAAIGLVEVVSISRSIASQTGQRLNTDQEFVGQGLAGIACGFFSGYCASGSFARSAVNYEAQAKSALAGIISGLFVAVAIFVFAPWARFIPRAALSGVLVVTGIGMIDRAEMVRIWRGTRGDTVIMGVTFLGTLFLPLEFAVLTGILASFGHYVLKTSVPEVKVVLPDDNFNHLIPRPGKPSCPQLGIIDIMGDLYFGAVNHVEELLRQNMQENPEQRFLLIRMRSVNHLDISGVHMLEGIMRAYRERGGDLYLMRVPPQVRAFMRTTGFRHDLGIDRFLPDDEAVTYLFNHILDPAICIYECEIRAFYECQNLPKQSFVHDIQLKTFDRTVEPVKVSAQDLRQKTINEPNSILVLDVREPREYKQGHIPGSIHLPLLKLISQPLTLPMEKQIVCVCRSGRRSIRAVYFLEQKGYKNVAILEGGILAWEGQGFLEAVEN